MILIDYKYMLMILIDKSFSERGVENALYPI